MKKLSAILLLTAALVLPGFAKEFKVPKEKPIASFTFPNKWEVEVEDESITAQSEDSEVLISIEAVDAEALEGAIVETHGYLLKNKVKIKKDTEKKQEGEYNGFKIIDHTYEGTDEDGPVKISITVLVADEKNMLVMLFWASPDAETKHKEELGKIQQSIKKL